MRESTVNLSEGQKSCLRLVAQGMSSKEIAKALDLTPQTVDTYLKASMARLGASNRREAARMLVASEAPQKLGSLPEPLAGEGSEPEQTASTGTAAGSTRWNLLPPVGGGSHDLNWSQKTLHALWVAVISTAVVIAIAMIIAGAFRAFS